MHCPFCSEQETKVIDSRLVSNARQIRRRRECISCSERFTTYETAELLMPYIIKRDNRRKPFDEEKLRNGILRSLEKRPVSTEDFEATMDSIKSQIRANGEREINSQRLGEIVMQQLKQLDEVAYVRFASVYRRFQDVNEFSKTIDKLHEVDNS